MTFPQPACATLPAVVSEKPAVRRAAAALPYVAALAEQALASATNLGVGLVLVRLAAPSQFGAYAFWSNTAFVLASVLQATSLAHLLVLPRDDGPHRRAAERSLLAAALVFTGGVAAALLGATLSAAVWAGRGAGAVSTPAAALFAPAFLLQQIVRALAFSRGRAGVAAAQTGAVLALSAAGLGWAMANGRALDAGTVLGVLGAAYGGTAAVALAAALRGRPWPGWRDLFAWRAYLPRSGWILLGASSSELLARFYAFATTAVAGPAALGALSAAQLPLRPVPLLANAWGMAARGGLNRMRDRGDTAGLRRHVLGALALGLLLAAGWTAAVALGWGWLSRVVFAGRYPGEARLVLAWGLGAGLGFGQLVLGVSLQTLQAWRPLALANAAAAAAGALLVVAGLRLMPIEGAAWGAAAGQAVEFGLMAALLARRLRDPAGVVSGAGSGAEPAPYAPRSTTAPTAAMRSTSA